MVRRSENVKIQPGEACLFYNNTKQIIAFTSWRKVKGCVDLHKTLRILGSKAFVKLANSQSPTFTIGYTCHGALGST
jgi:hypothetical protein